MKEVEVMENFEVITLTNKDHKQVIVDKEFFDELSKYKWHENPYGYAYNDTLGFMHRYIMSNPCREFDIDHINHNKLDNRKCNLRLATRQQNCWNASGYKNSKSKFKGVYYRDFVKKPYYEACSCWEGKHVSIGCYVNELEAACAYNLWAKEHFKEFAYLNNFTEDELKELQTLLPLKTLGDRKNEKKTSKYKYISYCKDKACWCYSRMLNKVYYRKKGFKTEEEAHDAYIERMKEIGVEP